MRAVLINLGLIAGTLVFGVAAFVVHAAVTNPPRSHVGAEAFTDERYTVEPNAAAGFSMRPNIVVEQSIASVTTTIMTDSRGARRSAPGLEAPASVDLITVGCSQSFGTGVNNEHTFTSRAAERLGLQAANYSVPAYGGVGSLHWLRRHIDQKPKFVVYGFWENHLDRNVNRCLEMDAPICVEAGRIAFDANRHPSFVAPSNPDRDLLLARRYYRETGRGSDQFRSLWTDVFWTGMRLWQNAALNLGVRDPGQTVSRHDKIVATKLVLSEMKKAADLAGAQLIVVYIPYYFESVVKGAPRELESFAERAGIAWISMTDRFNELKRQGQNFIIPNDGHLNERGHLAIAEEIETFVRNSRRHADNGYVRSGSETEKPETPPITLP